ncbi:MAG: response regulator [Proteobacteria bacterium]|nr:response regulator [Pseudomonadota bacterium]
MSTASATGFRRRTSGASKILVVEDDPINQMILADFLAANGYVMVTAATGPEGLEQFEREAPDLLIVDVQLPRMNGFELCRAIKGRPDGSGNVPILLMSAAYTDRDQSNRTVQLGTIADGHLTKPFDLVQLLAQVRALLP